MLEPLRSQISARRKTYNFDRTEAVIGLEMVETVQEGIEHAARDPFWPNGWTLFVIVMVLYSLSDGGVDVE